MMKYLHKFFTLTPMLTFLASVVTFWITGIWWVVPLGLAASGIITVQSALAEAHEEVEEDFDGYDLASLHPELREKFRHVLNERTKIIRELQNKKEDTYLNRGEISQRVDELVDGYYDLLLKLEKIRPFIDQSAMARLNDSIESLRRQIRRCRDEITRENLSLALRNKMDQLDRLKELERYRNRIESQLIGLVSAMSSLHVRIVHIGLSPDSSLDPTKEIKESLNDMLLDVEVSEKVNREFKRILSENSL